MLVRALRLGIYGKRRRPGEEFEIQKIEELAAWMERVNAEEPVQKKKPGPKKKSQSTEDGVEAPLINDIDLRTAPAGSTRLE